MPGLEYPKQYEATEVKPSLIGRTSMWEGYKFGVPNYYSNFIEDYFQYVAGDYTVTTTGTGTAALSTTEQHGCLLLTNSAADDDALSLQRVGHAFAAVAGKKLYFEARAKISDATQSDFLIGLVATDTTPLANANSICFRKDDGDTNIDFSVSASSVVSDAAAAGTLTTGFIKYGFMVNGVTSVDYWINDVKIGTITTALPTAALRATIHVQNGEAVAKLGTIDYIYVAQER